MAIFKFHPLFLLALLSLSLHRPVLSNHDEELLLEGINNYRTSLNLAAFTYNDNAECLAEGIAELFKHQPCTTSGPASVQPGFPGFLDLLTECELNEVSTRDGDIMPACVPDLDASDLVLSSFTKSRYNKNLNDSKFTGIGIATDHEWVVVILTTNTSEGGFTPVTDTGLTFGVNHVVSSCLLVLLFSFFMF